MLIKLINRNVTYLITCKVSSWHTCEVSLAANITFRFTLLLFLPFGGIMFYTHLLF